MSLSRKDAVPVLLALLAAAGCAREERSITAHARAMTVVRADGAPDVVMLEGRIWDTAMSPDAFDAAWDVVTRRAAPYDAFMITLERVRDGIPGDSDLLVGLVLAVPLPLGSGMQYPIGHAFAPPSDMPMYWRSWGRRDLQVRGTAVLLRIELTATDATGAQVTLSGEIDVRAERYRPPIT